MPHNVSYCMAAFQKRSNNIIATDSLLYLQYSVETRDAIFRIIYTFDDINSDYFIILSQ